MVHEVQAPAAGAKTLQNPPDILIHTDAHSLPEVPVFAGLADSRSVPIRRKFLRI